MRLTARTLVPGEAEGEALVLEEPLSLWGGLDPTDGRIIDPRHSAAGAVVTGRMLALPSGKGSSSASSILLEAVRRGTEPAAILTRHLDSILVLGAVVARELYGRSPPVALLAAADFARLRSGQRLSLAEDGSLSIGTEDASR